MADIPVLCTGDVVRAILAGRQTQDRRPAWRDAKVGLQDYASEQLEDFDARGWRVDNEGSGELVKYRVYRPTAWQKVRVGDRLWVRENFTPAGANILYAADHNLPLFYSACDWYAAFGKGYPAGCQGREDCCENSRELVRWVPSIHMKRDASRLTLIVTEVRREILQNISAADARAEGIEPHQCDHVAGGCSDCDAWDIANFAGLWQSVYGADAWAENPEVVAMTFAVHESNIDRLDKAVA